jgi:hypothetical protein
MPAVMVGILSFSSPVAKELFPFRVFPVKDGTFLFGQPVRVVGEHVVNLLFVESEQPFADTFICVVNPQDDVIRIVLAEHHLCGLFFRNHLHITSIYWRSTPIYRGLVRLVLCRCNTPQ